MTLRAALALFAAAAATRAGPASAAFSYSYANADDGGGGGGGPPLGCVSWFDGCNTCDLHDGSWACTEMACDVEVAPSCLEWETGDDKDTDGGGDVILFSAPTTEPTAEPRSFAECADSEAWFLRETKPGRGCAWIAKKTARCAKVARVTAAVACAATCSSGAADSATWFKDFPDKGCGWAAKKPVARCPKKGDDAAADACPRACDAGCAGATAAPTGADLDVFEGCADSSTWRGTKERQNCAWVAKRPEDRCAQTARAKAEDACAATCGDGSGADSATWYWKKADRDCGWVAKKAAKFCKRWGTDPAADPCPEACGGCAAAPSAAPSASRAPTGAAAMTDAGLRAALALYFADAAGAEDAHGPVASWDTSLVTDMADVFYDTDAFNADVNSWDVSRVADMTRAFCYADVFNGNVGGWDVSRVTSMYETFHMAVKFQGTGVDSWDVGAVADFAGMFKSWYGESAFDQDLGDWNVGAGVDFGHMFMGASKFRGLGLERWDTSAATRLTGMFQATYGGTQFDGDVATWDTSKVTNMVQMFESCNAFDRDLSAWDLSACSSIAGMFRWAYTFDQDLEWCLNPGTLTAFAYDDAGCEATSCTVGFSGGAAWC